MAIVANDLIDVCVCVGGAIIVLDYIPRSGAHTVKEAPVLH